YRLCLLAKLRNRLAICQDWNLVTQIWELKLPRGMPIPVVTGEGLPQSVLSGKAVSRGFSSESLQKQYDNQYFKGGELQIWLPWMPALPVTDYMQLPRESSSQSGSRFSG
ncbi:MAG: hypothetical protein ABSA96_20100, partial [Candidatus Acidiferrales bacterium]